MATGKVFSYNEMQREKQLEVISTNSVLLFCYKETYAGFETFF